MLSSSRRLLRHSARKRGGLNLQSLSSQAIHGTRFAIDEHEDSSVPSRGPHGVAVVSVALLNGDLRFL